MGGGRGHERGLGDPVAMGVSHIDPWTSTFHSDIDEMFAGCRRQGTRLMGALQRVLDGTCRSATISHTNS